MGSLHWQAGIGLYFVIAFVRIAKASCDILKGSISNSNSESNTAGVAAGVVCIIVHCERFFERLACVCWRVRATGAISDKVNAAYNDKDKNVLLNGLQLDSVYQLSYVQDSK